MSNRTKILHSEDCLCSVANSPVRPHRTAAALHQVLVFLAAHTQTARQDTLGVAKGQSGF